MSKRDGLPALKDVTYIADRAARQEDVDRGDALFVLEDNAGDFIGVPYDKVEVPQYALHKEDDGSLLPGVVIQAELIEISGQVILGMLTADDKSVIGLLDEFQLLGTDYDALG